ncbi:hypothetical protein C5167_016439, partial [Papaver somniferum]
DSESGFCSLTGIYYSKWESPNIPKTPSVSLPSFLLSQLSPRHLKKPAYIDSVSGKSLTYQELRSLSIRIASTLHSSFGIKKGDVVLVVSSNSIHFPLLILSIMSMGAIFSTANPLYSTQELQCQIQDSNPVLVFKTHEFKSKFDAARSTAVLVTKYSVEEMLSGIERYNVTRLPVAPPMVICSGTPLGNDIERFCKIYPQINLTQCYGLTETNGPITLCDGRSRTTTKASSSSVGRLIPSMEAKTIHVKTGKPLPPFSSGELCVRGVPVTQGYFKNAEATLLAIDKDGWLHTGDLCFVDKFGFVHIVDRIKELIKYKAYQVAPAELEEILSGHPEITDAAVISYPDEEAGEIPMAYVVRNKKSKIVERISRSPSGKILRKNLEALAKISPKL